MIFGPLYILNKNIIWTSIMVGMLFTFFHGDKNRNVSIFIETSCTFSYPSRLLCYQREKYSKRCFFYLFLFVCMCYKLSKYFKNICVFLMWNGWSLSVRVNKNTYIQVSQPDNRCYSKRINFLKEVVTVDSLLNLLFSDINGKSFQLICILCVLVCMYVCWYHVCFIWYLQLLL